MATQKTWFITGASKGFGLSLVNALLAGGHSVAATSRSPDDLVEAIGRHDKFLPLGVNLTSEADVKRAIDQTADRFGRIDVVVNNAGYGLIGGLEELTDEEVRQHFDVNVFAQFYVIRHALPYLRKQQSGHIFNFASTAGYVGYAGNTSYNATKFAVVGLSQALALELKPFGIHVTVVAPGMFRTQFFKGGSMRHAGCSIDAYGEIHALQTFIAQSDGQQAGDPDKAAQVLIRMANEAEPPVQLLLGTDAYESVSEQLTSTLAEFETQKSVTVSTDFSE